ncbi:hypothetical protein N7474_008697 [Penicillium riverlandense]|uniref:uncharacterized protein n=1 Tax=Penicillium riverlandense TaxID=1903569 RepID=UPI0025491C8E|nr:uncharacterized protein N7474_008697 [Penicillium riverlandense]KAJ5812396.1 hypothetical protein N7474_008697 [Penicillium riverlandense]
MNNLIDLNNVGGDPMDIDDCDEGPSTESEPPRKKKGRPPRNPKSASIADQLWQGVNPFTLAPGGDPKPAPIQWFTSTWGFDNGPLGKKDDDSTIGDNGIVFQVVTTEGIWALPVSTTYLRKARFMKMKTSENVSHIPAFYTLSRVCPGEELSVVQVDEQPATDNLVATLEKWSGAGAKLVAFAMVSPKTSKQARIADPFRLLLVPGSGLRS